MAGRDPAARATRRRLRHEREGRSALRGLHIIRIRDVRQRPLPGSSGIHLPRIAVCIRHVRAYGPYVRTSPT